MIGSIDILATISSSPVVSIASSGPLSGIVDQPPVDAAAFAPLGRASSLMKAQVARNVTKITAPDSQKVSRIPISGGSAPPISGPTRLPAIMPDDSTPSAQP